MTRFGALSPTVHALAESRMAGELRRQHYHRDGAIEAHAASLEGLAHAPEAQRSKNCLFTLVSGARRRRGPVLP